MSIIYTLIAKSSEKVLCEYTECHGNFEQVSRSLLKKINFDYKETISYDNVFAFHYSNSDNLTFMCMCDSTYPYESAFAFLEDIKSNFLWTFSAYSIEKALSYSLNSVFQETIKTRMEYFNNKYNKAELVCRDGKDELLETSNKIEKGGEKVQMIVKKVDKVRASSIGFYDSAKKVKLTARRRRVRVIIMIVILVIILLYLISVFACGFDWSACSSR